MDAHLDNRVIRFVEEVISTRPSDVKPLLLQYTQKPPELTGYEILAGEDTSMARRSAFIACLIEKLKTEKRVYLMTASKGFGYEVLEEIQTVIPELRLVSSSSFLSSMFHNCNKLCRTGQDSLLHSR